MDPGVLRSLGRLEDATADALQADLLRCVTSTKDPSGVTIFVPNWNQRPFLARALTSALAALEELERAGLGGELIVVDDGSRDGSQRLLRSVEMLRSDTRIATAFLPHNIGLARVRNAGLRLARFRHILFLDADNELVPENAPLFVQAMRETNAALVYGKLLDRAAGEIVGERSHKEAEMDLFDANYIDALALFDVEQVLLLGGFSTTPLLYGWEDWELILQLVDNDRQIVFVPELMGYYHVGRSNMLRETVARASERRQLLQRIHAPRGSRGWDPRRVARTYSSR
jgi:glycosyltransferase involved in cell wall biosynthesis